MIVFLLCCTLLIREHNYVVNQIIYLKNNWEKLGQKGGEEKGYMGYLPLPQLYIRVLHINESVREKKGATYSGSQ